MSFIIEKRNSLTVFFVSLYFFVLSFGFLGNYQVVLNLCFSTLFLIIMYSSDIEVRFTKNSIFILLLLLLYSTFIYLFIVLPEYGSESLNRYVTQCVRLFSYFMIFVCGFNLKPFISICILKKILNFFLSCLILSGLLQLLLYNFNLPVWGISLQRNYSAIDLVSGFRVNGFVGEPKTYGVIMACATFYFYKQYSSSSNIQHFLLMLVSFVLLIKTSSGNAILAFIFGFFVVNYKFLSIKRAFLGFVFCFLFIYFLYQFQDYIIVRDSHKEIFSSLLINFDVNVFDDLIKLPLNTWIDKFYLLPFGYGFGLLHYFSLEYIGLATWFKPDYGYISSNISFINMISDFGFVVYFSMVIKILRLMFKSNDEYTSIALIILIPFFIGAIHVLPVFFLIGYLFRESYSR